MDALLAAREMIGEVRTGRGPGECRSDRNCPIEIIHIDHAVEHQVDRFPQTAADTVPRCCRALVS